MKRVVVCLCWVLGCAGGLAPDWALAVGLQPHRAVYRMTLGETPRDPSLIGVEGAMEYRFEDVCDGWAVTNRTELRFFYDFEGEEQDQESDPVPSPRIPSRNAEQQHTVWNFTSWESRDGRDYRFRVRQREDDKLVDSLTGRASLKDGSGRGGGIAVFSDPPDQEPMALPEGVLFPTRHLIELLDAAARGETILWRVMFDGASLDNPYGINAVLREVSPGERKAAAKAAGLPEVRTWSIRLAYYPLVSKESSPDFELVVRYREDGIADELEQDYGDFSLRLQAARVELLPRVCR